MDDLPPGHMWKVIILSPTKYNPMKCNDFYEAKIPDPMCIVYQNVRLTYLEAKIDGALGLKQRLMECLA